MIAFPDGLSNCSDCTYSGLTTARELLPLRQAKILSLCKMLVDLPNSPTFEKRAKSSGFRFRERTGISTKRGVKTGSSSSNPLIIKFYTKSKRYWLSPISGFRFGFVHFWSRIWQDSWLDFYWFQIPRRTSARPSTWLLPRCWQILDF